MLSFGVSMTATPILRWIAYRTKVVDQPDELLKPHGRPTAYLGGVAIYMGLLAGLAAYLVSMPGAREQWSRMVALLMAADISQLIRNPVWNVLGIALAGLVVMVLGLLDDLFALKPRAKVIGQVLAAVILLGAGVGDRMSMVVLALVYPGMPDVGVVLVSLLLCVILVIMTCNAMNLIDGLDGLCGGVTGIIALGFLALSAYLATYARAAGTDPLRVGLCLAMAGAVLGFLPYNVPPASIFMGDAGSMLLGFFVATMMALFCQEANARWFVAACAVFALPILDTSLAVVRRVLSGKSIFTGDRSHLYDQLVDRGMTVKQVVVLFYVLAAVAAALGVSLAVMVRLRYAAMVYVLLLAVFWIVSHRLGMVRPQARKPEPTTGPDAQAHR